MELRRRSSKRMKGSWSWPVLMILACIGRIWLASLQFFKRETNSFLRWVELEMETFGFGFEVEVDG